METEVERESGLQAESDGKSDSSNQVRGLNRDVIKYIAMVTMLLNHIAHTLLPHGTALQFIFEFAGYFTAPTMCYFLVEGYEYTRSKKKYGQRLLVFAVISQFAFSYAFSFGALNMIYTLFICFLILVVKEKMKEGGLKTLVTVLLVLVTAVGDWPFMAAIYTLLFASHKGSKTGMVRSYAAAYLIFVLFNLPQYMVSPLYSTVEAVLLGLLSGIAVLISGVVVLFLYNGKRAGHGRTFSKWFFYLFYPGHLFAIGLIERFLM